MDAAQNVHGVRVEDAYRRTIINFKLHALWSLGATIGGFIGAFAAAAQVLLGVHLSSVAAATVVLAVLATWLGRLPAHPRVATPEDHPAPPTKLPKGAWGPDPAAGGAGGRGRAGRGHRLQLVSGLSRAGRRHHRRRGRLRLLHDAGRAVHRPGAGDLATDRWGRVNVMRAGGVMIAVGGLLIVGVPTLPTVFLGYALVGFGCATVIPAAYAAAGRLLGLPEGAGITLVSWLLRVGFLTCSPIIGLVSDPTDLRVSLTLLVIAGLAIIVLALWSAAAVPPPKPESSADSG